MAPVVCKNEEKEANSSFNRRLVCKRLNEVSFAGFLTVILWSEVSGEALGRRTGSE